MYKKIIKPTELIEYQKGSIDINYFINEGERALGVFAADRDILVPTQIAPKDVSFYILEGKISIKTEDKIFNLSAQEMLLLPKTTSYEITFLEKSKILLIRI